MFFSLVAMPSISLKHRGILINPNDVCPICEQTLFQVSIEHRRLVYKDITAFPCKYLLLCCVESF